MFISFYHPIPIDLYDSQVYMFLHHLFSSHLEIASVSLVVLSPFSSSKYKYLVYKVS